MQPKIVIRSEKAADLDAIRDVTVSALKTLAIRGYPEPFIIAALRAAQALTVSLVAEIDGRVAGHMPHRTVTFHAAFKADGRQVRTDDALC